MREFLERRSNDSSLSNNTLSSNVDIGQVPSNDAGGLNYGLGGEINGNICWNMRLKRRTFPLRTMFLLPQRMHVLLTLFPEACSRNIQIFAHWTFGSF